MLSQAGFCCPMNMYRLIKLFIIFALVNVLKAFDSKTLVSRRRFKNQYLNITAIKNTEVRSLIECVALCSENPECESVNYCIQDESSRGNCSLNKEHLCQLGGNSLEPMSGCEYLDSLLHIGEEHTNSACSTLECLHGGRCSIFCGSDVVTCECTPEFFGNRCQHLNGGWGAWGSWKCKEDDCYRTRKCNNPSPVGEGRCTGPSRQKED